MRILIMVLLPALLTVSAQANPIGVPPIKGSYLIGNLDGWYSESWNTSGYYLELGNTLNLFIDGIVYDGALYWDTENGLWTLSCPSIYHPPTQTSDTRDENGTGDVIYSVDYTGGTFSLSKEGPWSADRLFDFPGYLTDCYLTTHLGYYHAELITVNSIMSAVGRFDWMNDLCLVIEIELFSMYNTNDAPLPPEYPAFLDPSCQAGAHTEGSYGGVGNGILTIETRSVPAEQVTWGQVKKLYGE